MPFAWITEALHPFGQDVGSLVPPVFEAYARVFHPAVRYPDDEELFGIDSDEPDQDVTWAEVATFNGRVAHPAMEWASITGSWEFRGNDDQPGMWNGAPAEGHLPTDVAARLAAVLSGFTTTPADCWFGIWSGFGFVGTPDTTLDLPAREYLLSRGPVERAAANLAEEPSEQSANLWWPEDRAWFVVTDVDLMTTYVGGSAACIAGVLAADGLEAAAVPVDQRVDWRADAVNPLPEDGPL